MDGKMTPSEAFRQEEQEEVANTNDAHEGNEPCHYFVEDEEVSISHIVNPILVEKKARACITPFLALPRQSPPTQTTTNPTIDYSWLWLMTSDEYMDALVEKARKKTHVKYVSSERGIIGGNQEKMPRG